MGTQFISRITPGDAQRILDGLRRARASVAGPLRRGRAAIPNVSALPPSQVRKLGDDYVGVVLAVAESHSFFEEFEQSTVFEEVLNWLKSLQNDALWNGFRGVIEKYDLEQSVNPTAQLSNKLREIIKSKEEKKPDPFRLPASNAARSVLAVSAARIVPIKPDHSQASIFGKRLATLHLRDIITQYIHFFINDFVSRVMDKADPHQHKKTVREAFYPSQKTAQRTAKRAVAKIINGGKLNDTSSIKQIVLEELRRLAEPGKTAVANL